MKESHSHLLEKEASLLRCVRAVTLEADLFELLAVKFCQEQVRIKALKATGLAKEVQLPREMSEYLFGQDIDVYESASLAEHLSESTMAAKTFYAAIFSLAPAMSALVYAKSDSFVFGMVALAGLLPSAMLAIEKLVRQNYLREPIPPYINEYYRLLQEFHELCRRLSDIAYGNIHGGLNEVPAIFHRTHALVGELEHIAKTNCIPARPKNSFSNNGVAAIVSTGEDEIDPDSRPSGIIRKE